MLTARVIIAMSRKKGRSKPAGVSRETVNREKVLESIDAKRTQGTRSIRFLPVAFWPENGLFVGAKDTGLRTFTGGRFQTKAETSAGTHPIFVLQKVGNLAHQVCPCSTKKYMNKRAIPKGCVLEHTFYVVQERTFLVEDCVFQVPKDKNFIWNLRYWGRVPETRLESEED
jgi:hypothetical protein